MLSVLSLAAAVDKPHVLFMISDDLRPELGAYGSQALTPNIDALAAGGLTFSRAFAQFPWCSPSRQSFMSGRRPDRTKAWNFLVSFRDALPDSISLSQHFRQAGWHAASVGKIYHGKNCLRGDPNCFGGCQLSKNASFYQCVQQPADGDFGPHGNRSWDEPPVDFARVGCAESVQWCESAEAEEQYCDYRAADAAIARLRAHAAGGSGKPLFLGVGFRDNHLKWAAPKRFRALYDPASLRATAHGATPSFAGGGVPWVAWQWPADVGVTYNLSLTNSLADAEVHEALRSYMASIAFTDAQVGRVVGALKEVGYEERTLLTFFGDHGQNLGEHNTWTKMTNWEVSLRVPLIVRAPWLPQSSGKVHDGMAELVDLYRTLSELAGIDPTTIEDGVEGESLAAAFDDPSSAGQQYAFSQTQRISVASLKREMPWMTGKIYAALPAAADKFGDPSCFSPADDIEWMG